MNRSLLLVTCIGLLSPLGSHGADEALRPADLPEIDWTLPADHPPVLFLTTGTLARLKTNLARDADPWQGAWKEVLAQAEQGLAAAPSPYSGGDFVEMRFAGLKQFGYASALALKWRVEGKPRDADKARDILLAWASAQPTTGSTPPVIPPKDPRLPGKAWGNLPDVGLNFADMITAYAHAYTILYPALTPSERDAVRSWMRYVAGRIEENHRAWLEHNCFGDQHYNNHLSVHNMGLAAIGFALRDERLVRLAFLGPGRGHFDMVRGAVLTPEKDASQFWRHDKRRQTLPGEIYDRYRVVTIRDGKGFGLPYSFLHLEALTYTAEMAFNNGIDVYGFTGPHGESLRLAYCHLAPYLITMDAGHYGSYHANDLLQPERRALYEIVRLRLGSEPLFEKVLRSGSRVVADDSEILGHATVLLYGEPVPPTEGDCCNLAVPETPRAD